jgi:phage repressor protein C with HTH and peptisase S24 domain
MLPLLAAGDELLIDPRAKLSVGDLVVARHPFRKDLRLVKTLVSLNGERAWLEGCNGVQSSDSRSLGALPTTLLLGKVSSRF